MVTKVNPKITPKSTRAMNPAQELASGLKNINQARATTQKMQQLAYKTPLKTPTTVTKENFSREIGNRPRSPGIAAVVNQARTTAIQNKAAKPAGMKKGGKAKKK